MAFLRSQKRWHPPPPGLQLPEKLLMITKSLPKLVVDFDIIDTDTWLVSERFFNLIIEENLLASTYESSKLTLISHQGKPVSNKQYYLLRFFKRYDDQIDFDKSPSIKPPKKAQVGMPPNLLQ
ncbi:Imm43 family immunity protein [Filimonas zeae]|nr:Imm43 family immunity protein [Filimonas zeae]